MVLNTSYGFLVVCEFNSENYKIFNFSESNNTQSTSTLSLDAKAFKLRSKYSNFELKCNFTLLNLLENEIPKVFFTKIRFIGKGFRLQSWRNTKTIRYTFGHSHMYMSRVQKLCYKRVSKYKYFFFSLSKKLVNLFKHQVVMVRPINPYTLRGLKVTKSTITKRKGRKSPIL